MSNHFGEIPRKSVEKNFFKAIINTWWKFWWLKPKGYIGKPHSIPALLLILEP